MSAMGLARRMRARREPHAATLWRGTGAYGEARSTERQGAERPRARSADKGLPL